VLTFLGSAYTALVAKYKLNIHSIYVIHSIKMAIQLKAKNMGKIIFSKKPTLKGKKIQFFLVVVSGDTVDMVELLGLLLGWTDWN
jgi:hypothetical protein